MKFNYFTGIIALLVVFSSCKKKKDEEVAPVTEKPVAVQKYGKAVMHLHTFIGNEELDGYADDISVPESERRISMRIGEIFISHLELVDMNDNIVKMCDTVLLKKPEVISYYINKIPIGKYKAMRFKVEFDSTSNTKKFADKTFSEPSSRYNAHFAGSLDTATVPDLSNTKAQYEYYIQANAKSIQVILPTRKSGAEFNISETSTEYFHLYMDLNILFSGLKLSDPSNLKVVTLEENKTEIAEKITNNISNMFRYE